MSQVDEYKFIPTHCYAGCYKKLSLANVATLISFSAEVAQ